MDVLIEKLNGEKKLYSEIGLIARDFLVSTADVREYKSEIQGRPGDIDKGADYGPKTIVTPFVFESPDVMEYADTRDEVLKWLGGVEPFWIYEGRYNGLVTSDGHETFYEAEIRYKKRYLVRRNSNLAPDQNGKYGIDSITFKTVGLPFAETPDTTLNMDIEYDYSFNNPTTIQVYNGGTEAVDPEEGMGLVIEYLGASTNLKLENLTNGSVWSYTGTTLAGHGIKIDGVHSTKNDLSIVRDTNLELIRLEPGWNEIKVTGATSGTLKFDFPFYYR
ncbi:phage tail domain-containing protein [Bacillus marasmi]|uniref:phage tail domain-containing protein n=1 Tax=Bacillus marasmi TaxID=1926279 RepID=UPI0011C93850|nr:phage tail domain-containing protein [Bacillus marasmi]